MWWGSVCALHVQTKGVQWGWNVVCGEKRVRVSANQNGAVWCVVAVCVAPGMAEGMSPASALHGTIRRLYTQKGVGGGLGAASGEAGRGRRGSG